MTHHTDGEERVKPKPLYDLRGCLIGWYREPDEHSIDFYQFPQPVEAAPHGKQTKQKTKDDAQGA